MASGDDSWVPPGTRDSKGRHLRGVADDPAGDAVVLSFTDAVQRRSPRVVADDATTAPEGWPAQGQGGSRRRLSVVGEDGGAEEPAGAEPPGDDDGPYIA